jgi:hypothetical protein
LLDGASDKVSLAVFPAESLKIRPVEETTTVDPVTKVDAALITLDQEKSAPYEMLAL